MRTGNITSVFLIAMMVPWYVSAQLPGKIVGHVSDQETDELLQGVNIVVVGTYLGAATDSEGDYMIINVSPSLYELQATMIGYEVVRINGVEVLSDLTTHIDFQMVGESLKGEEITITAERPLIQEDVTTSVNYIGKEELNSMPASDYNDLLVLNPGMTRDAKGFHLRGGRSREIVVQVDGIPIQEPNYGTAFAGTVGKSAQFPLHVWLPDAMEGPTPVSAMIHAAAMVSAGVYMVIRMFPLLNVGGHGSPALTVMAFVGAFTALFAATIAVAQNDVKRVLAYSTISQLGYMIAALGIGAYVAAAFHLMTHAFFKALLFMGSGSIIHGVEHGIHHTNEKLDPQDMLNMGGLAKRMPTTYWTFVIGGLSLAGFPFVTAGFWSKDEILADAFAHGHWWVFVVLLVSAFLTAFYTMRQISLTFLGDARTESAAKAHESAWTMTLPLVVLSFFAVFAGYVGVHMDFPVLGAMLGSNPFEHFVIGSLPHHGSGFEFEWTPVILSVVAGISGLSLGWLVYGRRPLVVGQQDPLVKVLGPLYGVLANKYYFDELYDVALVRPAKWISEVVAFKWIDRVLIDGALHSVANLTMKIGSIAVWFEKWGIDYAPDKFGDGVRFSGHSFRVIQSGRVQDYLNVALSVVVVIGAVLFVILR